MQELVEHSLSMCKALGSIPPTVKRKEKTYIHKETVFPTFILPLYYFVFGFQLCSYDILIPLTLGLDCIYFYKIFFFLWHHWGLNSGPLP
jgi:hypothetical protein